MRDAGRDEQEVARPEGESRVAGHELPAPGDDHVHLVLLVRRLGITAARRVYLHLERPAAEGGVEALLPRRLQPLDEVGWPKMRDLVPRFAAHQSAPARS